VTPHPADHPGPLAFVADLDAPTLGPGDHHHLTAVLRLRPGDPLTIGDGRGRWRAARLDGQVVIPTGPVEVEAPPAPAVCVGFALVKGEKPELVVQKLTELGIDRIVPFRAERSVVRWDDAKATKAVERLRLVARAAAMQSHRPTLPAIDAVAALADLVGQPGAALAERGGGVLGTGTTMVLIGPEGGWSRAERASAQATVELGGHVLRSETAAITAAVLLTGRRAAIG
jgi:16S rRNA (uracil1498-N3)-methyltransferase